MIESVLGIELTYSLLLALTGILLAAFVKGVLSFGIGLVAIPILIQIFPPHLAITAFIVPIWLSNMILIMEVGIPFEILRQQRWLGVSLIAGTLVGVLIFTISDVDVLYVIVSLYVLAYLLYINSGKDVDRYATTRGASIFTGGVSGFLTSVNMPGPPMITYMHAQKVEKRVFTGVLVTWFGLLHTIRFGALRAANQLGLEEVVLGAIFCVPVAIGIPLGSRVRPYIPQRTFEKLVEVFLALIALRMLSNAIL
ncbi:sulfite exporter TauE/SafE family protein [Natrinema halophilum]|uniref:sulfite exporter TauE/SafE family protein n=1 Tax=Natrinema halophilum TaxID=1699371 RepID=UPI001F33DB49|nr:sulfite exporter TauE/SafE family protein [Natrinema halophilum]UHQ96374.1 sulfite exporter TauE/SafE family protein [Natrinema halophilum]